MARQEHEREECKMEWSGVEKWLIEYVRTPGLFCKGRTCGEKKK
jgi:hypothetical protein